MEPSGVEQPLPDAARIATFRIVQEALNNVLKHAKAGEVIVTLAFGDETVKIFVYDNGAGFAVPERINSFAAAGKLGLTGIQERVRSLDGALDIKSQPGSGTLLSVEFKL